MVEKIRYGVLSTANIARNAHLPAARDAIYSQIDAISSRNKAKAEQVAQDFGIACAYGSYDELLADNDIDAVINPLPNSMHCEWTIRAAEAGKHILCEKPLAVTVDEAQRMIDAAKSNGVYLMEAFSQHFLPHLDYVRQVIEAGGIGPVRAVRAELVYTLPDWENDSRAKPELAGGALYDAGCYCVNTIRTIMHAEPVAVEAMQHMHRGVDASFSGLLRFANGAVAYMSTSMEMPFRGLCEVIGTQGRVLIPTLFGGDEVRVTVGGEERVQTFTPGNRFTAQLDHFSECILTGKAPKLQPEDALRNTKVLVALKQAATTGKTVEIT